MKKTAFTLSEILITLGVIGVVAAMTIPSVIHKYKIKSYETAFKKSYSMLSEALLKMRADDVYLEKGNVGFVETFPKYLKIIKKYSVSTRDLTVLGYKSSLFRDVSDTVNFNGSGHANGAFILNNGTILFYPVYWWTYSSNHPNFEFVIDTNGLKAPNRFGYDVFYFQIAPNNKLLPSDQTTFNNSSASEQQCCNLRTSNYCNPVNDNGCACAYYALKNQNPQNSAKGYWESLK